MNLYLVLALALGAVSAAPVPQPRVANVAHLECGGRAAALELQERQHGCRTQEVAQHPARRPPLAARRILTSAATPRAPACG